MKRMHVKSVLVHRGWWKHVCGAVKKEDASTDQARIQYIKNCQPSQEAWVRLGETYNPKGQLQKVSLYRHLINLIMATGGNINQHITSFIELAENLLETGIIQDEFLVIMLLSNLPA